MDVCTGMARQVINEPSGQQGSEQHAYGGEQYALCQDGFDFMEACVHSACEQDNAQGNHSDELGVFCAVELDA